MTLLDAPAFDEKKARRNRTLSLGALAAAALIVVVYVVLWLGFYHSYEFWTWPAQHRMNDFLTTIESADYAKAYGLWNHDPDWQKHPQQYSAYDFNQFQKDWGPNSDYGKIKSHKIVLSKSVGNGTVFAVDINGGKTPIFLRVDDKTKQVGFSPVELYVGP